MRKWKRIGALLLGVVLAASLLAPGSALAAFVSSGDGSVRLVVQYHPGDTSPTTPAGRVETQGYRLYHIADVNEAGDGFVLRVNPDGTGYGDLVGTPIPTTYSPYNFYTEVSSEVVQRVSKYINMHHKDIQPDYVAPVVNGEAEFTNLPAGLYLAVGPQAEVGRYIYTPTPFLICLPYQVAAGGPIYTDLSVTVKFTRNNQGSPGGSDSPGNPPGTPPSTPPDNPPETPPDNPPSTPPDNPDNPDNPPGNPPDNPNNPDNPDNPDNPPGNPPDNPNNPDNPSIEIPEDEVPLVDFEPDQPVPTVEIPDEGVPLINLPDQPTPTTAAKLPQTGQLWWPVPVLGIVGLALVALGLWGRRRTK